MVHEASLDSMRPAILCKNADGSSPVTLAAIRIHPPTTDWRTVLAEVLQELDSHVKAFWE